MEKYSQFRDASSGIAAFVRPVPPATESSPVETITLPLRAVFAAVRTTVAVVALLLHWLLTEVISAPLLFVPAAHQVVTAAASRLLLGLVLAVLGYLTIPVETQATRRAGRAPPSIPFKPRRGDCIYFNYSSYVELLYLASRFNCRFALPVSSSGSQLTPGGSSRITSWRSGSLLQALMACGATPERSERGSSLVDLLHRESGPLAIFPECTTSNNRAVIRFGDLYDHSRQHERSQSKSFLVAFKHEAPTTLACTATVPEPTNIMLHMFSMCLSPLPRKVFARRLHPADAPRMGVPPTRTEWEALAESLAQTGKLKRAKALDWEAKHAYLKLRGKA